MQGILLSLPDADPRRLQQETPQPTRLTVGKRYDILRAIGDGLVVRSDDDKDDLLVLGTRFELHEEHEDDE